MPFSLALILINGKYFDIQNAVEKREVIKEGIFESDATGAPLDGPRWSSMKSQTGGTQDEIIPRDFGVSAVSEI